MKTFALLALALFWIIPAALQAQTPKFPIVGKFYVDIDDAMDLYVNGNKVHHSDIGTSSTKELTLIPGDRLVVNLWNKGGPYGLKLLFVSTDRRFIINFKIENFRVLRDPDKKNFSEDEFASWKDLAHGVRRSSRDHLTFKNKAEWIWGEKKKGTTYIAGMITKGMFEKMEQ